MELIRFWIGKILIKKNFVSAIVVFIVLLSLMSSFYSHRLWKKEERVVFWDVKSYYAYLPAVLIHGDLTFSFIDEQPEIYADRIWPDPLPNGNKLIITTMGLAILYMPFFLMGHLVALVTGAETTGYSPPYFFFLLASSVFYLMLGLLALRRVLLKYVPDNIAGIVIAILFWGTNLYWYSTFEATMSHAYSFSLISIFILLSIKWHQAPGIFISVITGLIFGLIVLIRPNNGLVALVFILYGITTFEGFKEKFNFYLKNTRFIIVLIIFAFLVTVPQLLYWKYISGSWIINSYGDRGVFFFNNPQIFNGLFSYRKGWFVYTPVMLVSVLAIPFLLQQKELKKFFLPILIFLLINVYVILSWWSWWYGGGLGLRAFIDSYALLGIPMAAFLYYIIQKKWWIKVPVIAILGMLTYYGYFTNLQYLHNAIHHDSMTKEAFWDSFMNETRSGRFESLLRTPYHSRDFGLMDDILCDAEEINLARQVFKSTSKAYFFNGVDHISTEYSYSGQNSIKLNNKAPFGFTTTIVVPEEGDIFEVSVLRRSEMQNGYLIAQSEEQGILYKNTNVGVPSDMPGWEKLVMAIEIPKELDQKPIRFYCHNPYENDVYFDDIRIKLIPED